MKTLKEILVADHSKKTKKELVNLLSGLNEMLGDDYGNISGLSIEELSKTKNDDLVAIIKTFAENYDEQWEKGLAQVSKATLSLIQAQMAKDDMFTVAGGVADGDFAAELGSIDFEKLIGGPLNACVTAQANASMTTVNFIKEVGFSTKDAGTANEKKELIMVDFSYNKDVPNPDYDSTDPNSKTTISENVNLKVPFISILSIPSLRIETCEVDFNVKLNSTYTKDISSQLGVDASVQGGWGPVKFKVSASYKRSSATGVKIEKEYTMGVKVKATNDEMPAGLEKVLGILSE